MRTNIAIVPHDTISVVGSAEVPKANTVEDSQSTNLLGQSDYSAHDFRLNVRKSRVELHIHQYQLER